MTAKSGSEKWKKQMHEIEKKLSDIKYKRVAYNYLWWGGRVSTVWLGLDQRYFYNKDDKPLIFETMVFPSGSFRELDMRRYETEEQAKRGHKETVKTWSDPLFVIGNKIRDILNKIEEMI